MVVGDTQYQGSIQWGRSTPHSITSVDLGDFFYVLTDYVEYFVVDVECDEWNRQYPEVELEETGDGVDIFVLLFADVR